MAERIFTLVPFGDAREAGMQHATLAPLTSPLWLKNTVSLFDPFSLKLRGMEKIGLFHLSMVWSHFNIVFMLNKSLTKTFQSHQNTKGKWQNYYLRQCRRCHNSSLKNLVRLLTFYNYCIKMIFHCFYTFIYVIDFCNSN